MTLLFIILIIVASVALGFIVLVQNPKGGGLAGNIAGFSSQFMGVKQTNDVLERGTWIFAAIVGILCLLSTVLIPSSGTTIDSRANEIGAPAPANQPAGNTVPFNQSGNPASNSASTADSTK
ncbi:MAG: preprotein translocase subunit SecG [Terrimonas sp.]|nr:preprotein translocase subunit SecG [Terrimonas sp.]